MSLLAVGAQDQYIHLSPEMSYFKQVYRRNTNFSMESIRMTFQTKPVLESTSTTYTCRIGRSGDLLGQIYLYFELPDIYSDDQLRFRWIKNIANHMIYSYSVRIDTQLIDQRWGEWMDIWNELALGIDKKYCVDEMTGNTDDHNNPRSLLPMVTVRNNRLTYTAYPASTGPDRPSIRRRRHFVPLDFWFTKNPSLALPLIGLQYQNIDITIELRSINELYQIYDERSGLYVSPQGYMSRYPGSDVSIRRFTAYRGSGTSSVDLNAYLECNYYFLDEAERRTIAASNIDLLVERVYRSERDGIKANNTMDLVIANPVKEMVWFMRRADVAQYNEWGNFTARYPENKHYPIMSTAKIMWNGLDRIEDKPASYYNRIQPWQHHTTSPRAGIYCYSYALHPEKVQPSGSFNATMIHKIQMYFTTEQYAGETVDIADEYQVVVYTVYYNIFRVIGGSGAMVFT